MVTRVAFSALVLGVVAQRLLEMRRSRAHARALVARGAHEHAREQVQWLAWLHASWLVACLVEVWWLSPPFRPWLAVLALAAFAAGQTLRLAAMRALGPRWTIPVITVPDEPPVVGGIYRYIRHPNYVGVVLEIAALPLIHGAVWTAALFSAANAALLTMRIRAEEQALAHANAYVTHMGDRPRFVPRRPGPRGAS